MKIDVTCGLVRDLLPLYADGVLGEESGSLVEAHLPECPPCASELESLRTPVPVKKTSARKSLKATRRKLAAGLAVFALLVSAVLMIGFKVIPDFRNDQPIAYFDGLIDADSLRVYRDDLFPGSGMRGDFLFVRPARSPEFEFYGFGEACGEDVVTIDGERVGVLFIQFMKDPDAMARSVKEAAKHGGRNPMITSYGGSAYNLNPMTEGEKAERRKWETSMGIDRSGIDESQFASWARDIPITRVYYYSGPAENLLNKALGWSERGGVLAESVLIWDAETDPAAPIEFSVDYRPVAEGHTTPAEGTMQPPW